MGGLGGMSTGGGGNSNFMQNYNLPHPSITTALPYEDDESQEDAQAVSSSCGELFQLNFQNSARTNRHNECNHRARYAPSPRAVMMTDDGGDDDDDGGDDDDDGDGNDCDSGNGGIIVERVLKRGIGEATHYSSLYINNHNLLENSGYLMHPQQKYRTMTNTSVIPPALPMRNAPYDSSSQPNNTSGNGNNSASTLNRHYTQVYKTDQNINTNFKNPSNTQNNLDSSCTANRRKNF